MSIQSIIFPSLYQCTHLHILNMSSCICMAIQAVGMRGILNCLIFQLMLDLLVLILQVVVTVFSKITYRWGKNKQKKSIKL